MTDFFALIIVDSLVYIGVIRITQWQRLALLAMFLVMAITLILVIIGKMLVRFFIHENMREAKKVILSINHSTADHAAAIERSGGVDYAGKPGESAAEYEARIESAKKLHAKVVRSADGKFKKKMK